MDVLREYIDELGQQYNVPTDRIDIKFMPESRFGGGQTYLGMTWYRYGPENETRCEIGVLDQFEEHPLAYRAVAWHEFCHAESWILYRRSDGHNTKWIKRVLRKPLLFIGGEIFAALLLIERCVIGRRN